MSAKLSTLEEGLISKASRLLHFLAGAIFRDRNEARFQVLEAAACRLGSHGLAAYFESFHRVPVAPLDRLESAAAELLTAIEESGIEPAFVLSALAREQLTEGRQRSTGAYHTDYRLARRLAKSVAVDLTDQSRVIDPACGAGILLVALTLEVCGHDRRSTARFLRNGVYAADLSDIPLRGALLALASLTDDLSAVVEMRSHWLSGDSLLRSAEDWNTVAPEGFDAIIANPPWERVRLTRHEFARSVGHASAYGTQIEEKCLRGFQAKQQKLATYADRLALRHPLIARGEADLYAAFVSLYLEQLRLGGRAAVLVPGGLIRSQGTTAIRRALFDACDQIEIGVFDNRAKFFAIDTRFKFLALSIRRRLTGRSTSMPITLTHERGVPHGTEVHGRARLSRKAIAKHFPDLSLPEVKSDAAWRLFQRLSEAGQRMNEPGSPWSAELCREVDMTSDRAAFKLRSGARRAPVIEGRHVQQFRFGAKAYRGGSGRAARWDVLPLGLAQIHPQFYISPFDCSPRGRERMHRWRAGFCDIAGQTNERAMMAALIPPDVVCGNKVPTLEFPLDPSIDRLRVWVAIANSFTFDWLLRRVLTTTINYFVLFSVPLPDFKADGLPWKRIARAVERLHCLDHEGRTGQTDSEAADLRVEIELEVSRAYGLSVEDLALILEDFPLLDRGQPPLVGEARSTITRDTLLSALARRRREPDFWKARVLDARALGAVAFVPAQLAELNDVGRGGISSAGDSAESIQ